MKKLTLLLLVAAGVVNAATFNLFSPASGVLKGNPSTYVTTSATSTDVKSLWSGTCDSTSYLRGDGTCATPPGTGGGTVNSVSLTAPSVFAVSGVPITTTGTAALTFATGQTANQVLATPNGTTGAVGLRSLVAADLAAAGSTTQVQYNNSGAFAGSSSFTWTSGSNLLNLGSSSVPGTYSVGSLGAMTISGVALSVPSFASNSNIQGNLEMHSYVTSPASAGSLMYGVRARGTSASPTTVASGDSLLTIGGAGYDGTSYTWGAHIHFLADGTVSAGVLPGALDFQTTPAGSNTPISRLLIDSAGSYAVAGSHGTADNVLVSAGAGATAWGTVNLASANAVSGVTAAANGGTGVATLTGIAKGNGTSAFTAAVSSDVISTWGGSCSASTYLRGDGSCATPSSGGTTANPSATIGLTAVNGVAGTLMSSDSAPALSQAITPTWTGVHTFSHAGTAVSVTNDVTAGTFTGNGASLTALNTGNVSTGILAAARGGTANGFTAFSGPTTSTKTFTLPNASATVLTDNATVTVAQGGTGAATLTGYVKGSGTSAMTASATIPYSDLTGTPTVAAAANPTGTIGLTAVNGSAGTYLRSDGAPALSQAIAPTWTGNHIFSPASGTTTFNGAASTFATKIVGISTTGQSRGLQVNAGTNASDFAVDVTNQANTLDYFVVKGDGSISLGYNGSAASVTTTAAGNATINAPSSGTPLTVSGGSASAYAVNANGGLVGTAGTQYGATTFSTASSTFDGMYSSSAHVLGVATNGSERMSFASAGNVTINAPSSGTGLVVTGAANAYVLNLAGSTTSGQSKGLRMTAGTTSADFPVIITNASNTTSLFELNGVGGIGVNNGTYGMSGQVLTSGGSGAAPTWTTVNTCTTGSFTGTLTGMTATTTGTVNYRVCGNVAWLWAASNITGTSNSGSMTMTGLPAAVTPTTIHAFVSPALQDNASPSTPTMSNGTIAASGTVLTFFSGINSNAFSSSGTKGINAGWTIFYPLD